eukprot:scaffold90252_cov20-Tisochrysis_lutea.AAC.2
MHVIKCTPQEWMLAPVVHTSWLGQTCGHTEAQPLVQICVYKCKQAKTPIPDRSFSTARHTHTHTHTKHAHQAQAQHTRAARQAERLTLREWRCHQRVAAPDTHRRRGCIPGQHGPQVGEFRRGRGAVHSHGPCVQRSMAGVGGGGALPESKQ